MNKIVKIIIAVAVVLIVGVAAVLFLGNSKSMSSLNVKSVDDLTALVDKIYEGVSIEMPRVVTQQVDLTDEYNVEYMTGLTSSENIEYAVVSEPEMSSQAYSMVLVKVKDGSDVNAIAKSMNENINERKWLCVTAEKIYTVASQNVICLVMTNADTAKVVYDSFKALAGDSIGQEYERTAEEPELPEDMLPGMDMLPGSEVPAEPGEMTDDEAETTEEM